MEITGETLFISDTHLYHKKICQYEPVREKEYKKENYENHEDFLIDKWNGVVNSKSQIIHLGDLYLNNNKFIHNLSRLNGYKLLLKGNHDNMTNVKYNNVGFNVLKNSVLIPKYKIDNKFMKMLKNLSDIKLLNFILFEYEGKNILCSHFPIVGTEGYDHKYKRQMDALLKIFEYCNCEYNIHGHVHSRNIEDKRLINVSVENINYKPIKLKDLIKK